MNDGSSMRGLVAAWSVAGLVVLAVAVTSMLRSDVEVAPRAVLFAVALVTLATLVRADLHLASRTIGMNLSEVGLVAAFAMLDPAVAVVSAVAGWVLANLLQRVPPMKLAFNAAAATVGAGLSAAVVVVAGGGPIDLTTVAGLLVTVALLVVYGVVGVVAASSLFSRLDDAGYREVLPDLAIVASMTTALSGAVGILAVVLAASAPHVLPVLVVVLGLIYLSLRDRMVRMEHELHDHERLERVVAGARDGIALLDPGGRIELANPALRARLGCEDDRSLLGERLEVVLARQAGDRRRAGPVREATPLSVALAEVTAQDPHRRQDLQVDDRALALLLTGLFDRSHRRLGTIVLVVDVTEERERESLREELLARVSHELRTPLTAIGGFVETLQRRGSDLSPTDRTHYLDIVCLQTGRLERLVEDLLWTSRIERDRVAPAPVELSLGGAVAEVVEALGPQLHHPVESAVAAGVTAYVDPDHLQQVLANLLRNADTYGRAPVRVTSHDAGGRVVVAVVDHGDGVPPAFVPALFSSFEQASVGDRRTSQGLGLGLAIVRALVEANDGEVRYGREAGRTRFEVELPAAGPSGPNGPSGPAPTDAR